MCILVSQRGVSACLHLYLCIAYLYICIISHVYICKFVYYYRSAAYLRVCIYAVLSPLLIHSQLIELVVRNTRGELVLSGLIVVYVFSSDLDVKYATAGLGFLLIYRLF